jgi:hypothetical protein
MQEEHQASLQSMKEMMNTLMENQMTQQQIATQTKQGDRNQRLWNANLPAARLLDQRTHLK